MELSARSQDDLIHGVVYTENISKRTSILFNIYFNSLNEYVISTHAHMYKSPTKKTEGPFMVRL